MLTLAVLLVCAAFVASLPYWLPRAVVALRMRIFTWVNGEEGLAIPGKMVDVSHFKEVYANPAANGRSRGAALSDLFWYWLSPGPEMHQEHLEPSDRYEEVAQTTRRILTIPKEDAGEAITRSIARILDEKRVNEVKLVRLRDLMMPIWADFYYQLVFGEDCPPKARALIVGNANDVVSALKMTRLRHMERRHRLTRFLINKLEAGKVPHALPAELTIQERAFYLQGVFFNTAIVQMSEAMTHLILFIAQHQDVQAKLVADLDDARYLEHVINESLRVCPLFGIAHRITSADITVDEQSTIPQGSVLCFNYPEFHHAGYSDPEKFDPDRWEALSPREVNYVPFGILANRPCPAQAIALVTMRAAAREMLRRFAVYSSVDHTRSIPNRGPCLLVAREGGCGELRRKAILLFMRARELWENVGRSLAQLVLGTYMVWEARRLRLCQSYFEAEDRQQADVKARGRCPFHWHARPPSRDALRHP
jgi:hypothetical protein